MNNKAVVIIVSFVIVAGLFFYAGDWYGSRKFVNPTGSRQFAGGNRGAGTLNTARVGQGGLVSGEILSKDAQSLTVKLRAGGSQIVLYSPTTEIGKMASGTAADLKVGTSVTASGPANADGSITAQTIQIR